MSSYAIYPSLHGRVVFITGGGSGIGAGLVEAFCAQGARVTFVDINEDASNALVAEMKERLGSDHAPRFIRCDLRDVPALQDAIAQVRQTDGPIGALMNNAADDMRHDPDGVTVDYWDDRIAVNLRHQFFAAQAVRPHMQSLSGGSIVNFGSVSWMMGQGNMPCYTTAKSAIQGLTRTLARDFGPDNIRVTCIVPGWIMTQRQIDLWVKPGDWERIDTMQCLPWKVYPEHVARMALFLAADDSERCTAHDYFVDAGIV